MSTRAAIIVKNSKVKNNLYRHCDGYPDGLGDELKEFLEKYKNKDVISPDSLANDIAREEIAIHTDWIHSDEEYLYIIDCDTRMLTCYDVGFSWEYHKKFTRSDGKTDYCAWRDHIDTNNIENPIIPFKFSFANPQEENSPQHMTLDQSSVAYTPIRMSHEEARKRALGKPCNKDKSPEYVESYIQGYMEGYETGYEEGTREADEAILNRFYSMLSPNSKFKVKVVPFFKEESLM